MKRTREDTLFSLRYAVVVLERYARFWHRLHTLLRVIAFTSGTAAFGALMAESSLWTVIAGLIFAILQGIDWGIDPARREQEARSSIALYAGVLARQGKLSDDEIEDGYQDAVARDTVIVWDSLKPIAYNAVLSERGGDPAERFRLSKFQRAIDLIT
jgi:hypothetical protein